MGILEWKKQNISGGMLVPVESENPQLRGFRTLNGDTGLITSRAWEYYLPCPKARGDEARGSTAGGSPGKKGLL